jgi:hypothetical protein
VSSPSRPKPTARSGAPPVLALVAALALGGCGEEGKAAAGAEPVGQELGGSVAHLAQCSDWNGASRPEKLATIAEIRSQVNREDAGVTASELSDQRALETLDSGCSRVGSDSFRLHIMYARAAAFEPLRRIAEGEAEPSPD